MSLEQYFADLKLNSGCRRFCIVEDRALSAKPPTEEEIAAQEFFVEDLIRISAAARFEAQESGVEPPCFPMRQMSQTIDTALLESYSSLLSFQGSSSVLSLQCGSSIDVSFRTFESSLGNSGTSLGFTNSSIDDSLRSCGSLYSVASEVRTSQVMQMLVGNLSEGGTPRHPRRKHWNFGSRSK